MPQTEMQIKENLAIIARSVALKNEGKTEEAHRLRMTVALQPFLAKWAKEKLGPDFLLGQGYNLIEAEQEYGKDWLTQ
jgi:predicted unusual protein kinase regulating ubiquinone biosynthesis (AarF/ABC1/UbiB family)